MPGAFVFLKPVVWLAAIAFVVAFLGYLAVRPPTQIRAQGEPRPAAASGPASEEWNLPKHI